MKFQSSAIAITLAVLANTAIAAPAKALADISSRQDSPYATIFPFATSQYTVSTGAVTLGTPKGIVSKSTTNGGADITTLVTFYIDRLYAGRTCELVFELAPTDSVSGSGRAQVFTSIKPATTSTSTWPQGNLRDKHIGTLLASPGAKATWEESYQNRQFQCSDAKGKYYASELVGVSDVDHIEWNVWQGGPKVIVY